MIIKKYGIKLIRKKKRLTKLSSACLIIKLVSIGIAIIVVIGMMK